MKPTLDEMRTALVRETNRLWADATDSEPTADDVEDAVAHSFGLTRNRDGEWPDWFYYLFDDVWNALAA